MLDVFGLKSCDTCRAALRHLEAQDIAFRFHDIRSAGPDEEEIGRWADMVGWDRLLNRRGTTWRALDAGDRDGLDRDRAVSLMERHRALIKRPVIVHPDGQVTCGFGPGVAETIGG